MKRLVIVRHAKAEKERPHGEDFARPLSERGTGDAAEMGHRLARQGVRPDAVLASAALRTLETARIIARELDFPWREIRAVKKAYLADVDALLELVRRLDDGAACALLVGHNPGCSELAHVLGRGFTEELRTCAVVALDLPADTWAGVRRHSGSVRWYDWPSNRP